MQLACRKIDNNMQLNDDVGYMPQPSVRSIHGKLWTEFFPSFYGPSANHARHENKDGKNQDP